MVQGAANTRGVSEDALLPTGLGASGWHAVTRMAGAELAKPVVALDLKRLSTTMKSRRYSWIPPSHPATNCAVS